MCSTFDDFLRGIDGCSAIGRRLEYSVDSGSSGFAIAPACSCSPFAVAETEKAWAERLMKKTRAGP